MKRIVALVTSAVAICACSMPTAPAREAAPDTEKARSALLGASKLVPTPNGKLGVN